jgi:hypothetical protein
MTKSRRIRWAVHVAHVMRNILTFWLKKPEENIKVISLCKDGRLNTEINLKWNRVGVLHIHLVHDRNQQRALVNTVKTFEIHELQGSS